MNISTGLFSLAAVVQMIRVKEKTWPILSVPNRSTPYRATGYRYTYRTYVFQVSQGMALYPPKFAQSQSRGGGGKGNRRSSCSLEGIALYSRGIAEIVSPVAV